MARNIKARPPWQSSQAGLYWHPRDSAGQGERGPGGGGCRSPLPAGPRGEPPALRWRPGAIVVPALGSALTRHSGRAGLGSALLCSALLCSALPAPAPAAASRP